MDYTDFLGKELPKINTKIWLEAECFYEIGINAYDNMEKALTENGPILKKMYFLPALVNISFACELYLKSLLNDTTGHDLKTLFDKQDDNIKNIIKGCICSNENYAESVFEQKLDAVKDAFKTWRYYYEPDKDGQHLDIAFLKVFANALHNIIILYK